MRLRNWDKDEVRLMYLTEALLWIRTSLTLHKGSLDKDRIYFAKYYLDSDLMYFTKVLIRIRMS
jgi:hypothetical protein